jgi:predicted Zn-dependent protease
MALALVVCAGAGCVRNPATGERQLALISETQEIAIGRQTAQEVRESIGLYPDPRTAAYVEALGRRMAAATERPGLPWQFGVLNDASVNAVALPGGPVFVTRGLLTHLNSEAELAAVMGHEIGHVTARHSVSQISKAQAAEFALGLGTIIQPELQQWGLLTGIGLQLLFLKFSRDAERQADELGFRYMVGQGYDPRGMASAFSMLQRVGEGRGAGRLPEWLSTHPDPQARAQAALERIASGQVELAGKQVGRDQYLAVVDGMVYGEDPRQGFFQGTAFLHPALRFRVDLPPDWWVENLPQMVVARSPQGDAVLQLGLSRQGQSPEQALREFLSQQGIRPAGAVEIGVGGLPGASSAFQVQTDQGVLSGLVVFVSHGGRTFGLLGASRPERLAAYEGTIQGFIGSFRELIDPAALAVQPARLEVVTVPADMTVEEFQARFPSSVPVEEVALINGMQRGAQLRAGQKAKRVVGGARP